MSTTYKVIHEPTAGQLLDKLSFHLEDGWFTDYKPEQLGDVFWVKLYKEIPDTVRELNRRATRNSSGFPLPR